MNPNSRYDTRCQGRLTYFEFIDLYFDLNERVHVDDDEEDTNGGELGGDTQVTPYPQTSKQEPRTWKSGNPQMNPPTTEP